MCAVVERGVTAKKGDNMSLTTVTTTPTAAAVDGDSAAADLAGGWPVHAFYGFYGSGGETSRLEWS